ncbi:hypothetical protein N8J89_41295 [Crossiella sp. CA-258035]|uniref:hypothetical protein n=1 Tax=Crossiella sp. CA-258035 TaxID=2981138 RepID=UPI0024BCEDD4|nr:hypothetical protein [Crossiella sp. CA-258035]WHT19447.1 hypothetical protein N8J89_41295 [Crossiella sp. CA-258035]
MSRTTWWPVLLVLIAIAGCAATAPQSHREPDLGPTPAVRKDSDITLPLEAHQFSPDQKDKLGRAQDILIRDCAKRFGFDYPITTPPVGAQHDRPFGLVNAEDAASTGYKNPVARAQVKLADEAKAKAGEMLPELVAVLTGRGQQSHAGIAVPPGGCHGEARRSLGRPDRPGAAPGSENFVTRLTQDVGKQVEADSRLKAAFGSWRQCMSESGYDYRDPWGPNDDPAFAGETASAAERAAAVADVACRDRFNVTGIWAAVRLAYEKQAIERSADALRQHQHSVQKQLSKAAEVITGAK